MATNSLPIECRLINASIAAYSIVNGSIDPNAPGYAEIGLAPGTVPSCFTSGVNDIDAGFVAQTADNWVFLVFRGTLPLFTGDFWAWVDDWLQDFDIGPIPWTVNNQHFGNVEGGFATALLALWPKALSALAPIDLRSVKGVFISGHSKGAALSFLAASLLKAANPGLLINDWCFAAPLVCDRMFRTNYDKIGLGPLSVRYQNEYDLIPFLPWVPALDTLAAAERLSTTNYMNRSVTAHTRARAIENDYVPLGSLRYITSTCGIEYGDKAEQDALAAIGEAILELRFDEIAGAHSALGRYRTCLCPAGSRAPGATRDSILTDLGEERR